jgi:hypothetical protein
MSDIHDALAQLERRLSDLKRELVRMAEEPIEADGMATGRSEVGPRPRDPGPTYSQAEAATASRRPPQAAPRRPAPEPQPAASSRPEARDPEEIVARAEAEAVQVLTHAHDHLTELKAQVEQLQSYRMRLLSAAQELLHQFQEELNQLSDPAGRVSGAAAPGAAPPAVPPAPAPEPPWPTSFEGMVTIIVPWISRLQTVQVLEDSLTRVRAAQSVYLRGYHRGEVRLELILGEAVDLIAELNRVLPYTFALESARPDEIVIRLDRGAGTPGG